MYKNFSLSDEERKQIMEQHSSRGYKKPILVEQSQLQAMKDPDFFNRHKEKPREKPINKRIIFNNGGSVSIQASHTHYCEPRNDEGPYSEMELGFPSQGTEIPQSLLQYEETSQGGKGEGFNPNESVYGYVPVSVIKELIDANGGIQSGELPPMSEEDEEQDMGEGLFDLNFEKRSNPIKDLETDILNALHQKVAAPETTGVQGVWKHNEREKSMEEIISDLESVIEYHKNKGN